MEVVVGSIRATATAGSHQRAVMGVGVRPPRGDAGDLVPQGAATDVTMETTLRHGPPAVVTVEGRRYAPMPATSVNLSGRLGKESSMVFVLKRGFHSVESVLSRHGEAPGIKYLPLDVPDPRRILIMSMHVDKLN